MSPRPPARRSRVRALALGCLTVAVLGIGAAAVVAAPSPPVVIPDAAADVEGPLDLKKATLSRASDGRLRATFTFAARVTPASLLAESGPPGSVCLRVWTDAGADPRVTRADRLVCVTARSEDRLRASVFEQSRSGLPRRTGAASARLNRSGRSLILRVSQSALGRPARIRFAAEANRPGCDRTACIDLAPEAPSTRTFRLR